MSQMRDEICLLCFNHSCFPYIQVDADFSVDLLGELVRAYLAATNICYQVNFHANQYIIGPEKSHVLYVIGI